MKIKVSEESVVIQGKPYEEMSWGNYQFPQIYFANGAIYCTTLLGEDNWFDIGTGKDAWIVSKDGGNTWEMSTEKVEKECGVKLPNGDYVRFPSRPPVIKNLSEIKEARIFRGLLPTDTVEKQPDGSWPYPVFAFHNLLDMNYIYRRDTLPDNEQDNEWHYFRIKNGANEVLEEKAAVERPFASYLASLQKDVAIGLSNWPICGVQVDPEGNVWAVHYTGGHLNPINGAPSPNCAVELYKSTDNCKTFKLQSYIPFIPDAVEEPTAFFAPNFNEAAIEFMDDGSIIILMRTTDAYYGREWNPMYFARSTDGGKTFSKPVKFSEFGVLPRLVKLNCGVTLAAYGRPGIYVRPIDSKDGLTWGEPIEIMTPNDRSGLMNNPPERPDFHEYVGSCCNVDLKAISDNQALLVYSDFYYPDKTGRTNKKVKTILSRIITVENE